MKIYEKHYNWVTKRRFFSIDKYDSIRFIYEPNDTTTYLVISNDGWAIKSHKYEILMYHYLPKMGRLVVTPAIILQKVRQLY